MSHSIYSSAVSLPSCMPRPLLRPVRGEVRPNYRLRRLAAVLVAITSVALVVIVAFGLLAGSGGRPASASRAEPANIASAVHVALAGDSLWSIAQANHGPVDIDRYVDALIDLNGGTFVQVGQAVRLP
jgi:hypothetical protein